ncbi:6589_t:CDS:2, partial [Acaulospora colombiana]
MRGTDSKDPYFRTLPQVYMIPHQGSTSSTSEGIEKVFKSGQNFKETSSEENPVTSVVLLDEVGLAETSPHNPLKVLHALLEPPFGSDDDVPT